MLARAHRSYAAVADASPPAVVAAAVRAWVERVHGTPGVLAAQQDRPRPGIKGDVDLDVLAGEGAPQRRP